MSLRMATFYPSTLILPGVQITYDWILPELNPSTVLATGDTGYSNDEIHFNWIKHFNKHTKTRSMSAKRLLLLDGVVVVFSIYLIQINTSLCRSYYILN
jgi:hypothetical protein